MSVEDPINEARGRGIVELPAEDEPTLEELKIEVIHKSNNRCCICQTPFIQIHHIDMNHNNNIFDNLAPLCPNCHNQAHTRSNMSINLTPERIKALRDKWYSYCEHRRQAMQFKYETDFGIARLKLKNFDRSFGWATYGWAKTFSSLNENYAKLTKDEIIDRVFSTSNPTELRTYLETVKNMFVKALRDEKAVKEFRNICNAFGFDFDGKNVI